jgi:hypothetical protein
VDQDTTRAAKTQRRRHGLSHWLEAREPELQG